MDRAFLNVIVLGLAFMLVFTAFQTMGNIEQTVIDSINSEDPSFQASGYVSLSIVYAVFALANWLAPSVISVIGAKWSMVVGAVFYTVFIAGFLIPHAWLLYLTSATLGLGAALIWTGQGNYLTLNSTSATISRNSGVFWALLQCSFLVGNTFVFFQFQGKTEIDAGTRGVLFWTLLGVGVAGIALLSVLPVMREVSVETGEVLLKSENGPIEAFKKAWNLFLTPNMALLSVTFFYVGIEYSFVSGVYSNSIGFTKQFGENAKRLVGLSGIFIGVGEISGGAIFGILGSKFTKWGRDPVILLGFLAHVLGFYAIFLNIPDQAALGSTSDPAFIESNEYLAIFCSFLIGFGDSCYNTQIFSLLGGIYPDNSASAFALFKFVSSLSSACSFGYGSSLALYAQLGIIVVLSFVGTLTFWVVEWKVQAKARSEVVHADLTNSGGKHD